MSNEGAYECGLIGTGMFFKHPDFNTSGYLNMRFNYVKRRHARPNIFNISGDVARPPYVVGHEIPVVQHFKVL